uniref:E3 SUMO-protein ligase NSE2 n=1 Tax=Lepisosteus oculatus TaxID=7918 RepID=W5MV61_LEPOC|nr:PREDICTED: E3 SUMO-protein ligase NSE2 [Lepisosteus oculatus]XP_015213555.1 PREDICTED: E3 SUMO-protein ligase NSE2 [Lepisosteus oculatus]XP_015213556.1 PREDICTED: E3 SUMO-protein ligase NSE2 [Lepisosteus oculatus]
MSLNVVKSNLTSLKTCQPDISIGMDIVTNVALDLQENGGSEEDFKKLEQMMLNCARMEREINYFVAAVEEVTSQVRQDDPEGLSKLTGLVNQRFTDLQAAAKDSQLHKHKKVVQLKETLKRSKVTVEATEEELDEDIAVTQSQVNPTCPITQVDMVNPVKNKKCNHYYEQEAVLDMIRSKQHQKKKLRCPVVGCGNTDVTKSDLVPDPTMKRLIQNQKKLSTKSQM